MKTGGKGGALTKSGLSFEKRADLVAAISNVPGFSVRGHEILKNDEVVAVNCRKQLLYKFLQEQKVDYANILSKKLLPDEAIYVPAQKKLYIIEMKFQNVAGSVDEKLQTCDFKKKQYQKLFEEMGVTVEYIYILNDWFLRKEYRDVLNYIQSVGCQYYFNTLDLKILGLVNE
jgi:hypothetical protein